ncbi:outer mitochondrial membrane transport complex protein-domain-containing protein [Xylariaceae sp. FL0662B]|nr:outer mitochondrial membrane transport complex protein-domain-containing protein [Xylariaceae sp. FL0662B]
MALELHVWGPAFGLNSIDPECLAAISCFRHAVPRQDWTLIASNDATVSPDHVLPAVNHRGTWTSGYANIVSYLAKHAILQIDNGLSPLQRADYLACTSYLTTRGSGLLAMSLYVSPSAWSEVTRPAYSSLLPFPLTWTVPPIIRATAAQKAEHLGIGHLAAEVDTEDSFSAGTVETTSTGFLRLRQRLGPSKAMQPEHAAAIRFQHFAEDFYSVLDQLRGEKRFFLGGEKPSSLDFLVYGYLLLMRVQTPHPVLNTVLEKKFGRLVEFLKEIHAYTPGESLPWQTPPPRGALGLLASFTGGSLENAPGVADSWRRWRGDGVKSLGDDDVRDPTQLALAVGGVVVGLASVGAVALFRALSPLGASTHRFEPAREERTGLLRFGEIGAMLDGLPVWDEPKAFPPTRDTLYEHGHVGVSVDVAPAPGSPPRRDMHRVAEADLED